MDDWMHATDRHGIANLTDFRGAGLGPRAVAGLVKCGTLTALGHGWFATGPVADERDRHVLTTRAMLRSHGGQAVAGHHSALLLLELPTYNADLSVVRLTRRTPGPTRQRRSLRLGRVIPATFQRSETVEPGFAAVQHGLSAGPISALIAADGALHAGLTTTADLDAALEFVHGHPYSWGLGDQLRHADDRHESPGETRLAYAFRLLGIAATPQVPIPAANAVVDFLLDDAPVVVEFDGQVKYGRAADERDPFGHRRPGRDVLWQEKRREDRLRELGYEVVRVTWSDLDNPAELAARILRAIERSRRLTA